MSLLKQKLLGMPFGIATVEELLETGLLEDNAIYRRREIVEALRSRFVELGGSAETTPAQVIVPLKRVLSGPSFERVRSGFYRYVRSQGAMEIQDGDPAVALDAAVDRDPNAPWQGELAGASSAAAIVEILRSRGRRLIADRIQYLHQLAVDEPEESPIVVDSLRYLAFFLLRYRRLADPEVGISPNALAQVEWTLPDVSHNHAGNGLLAMEFLPSGMIRFAALSAPFSSGSPGSPGSPGVDRLTVHGTLPAAEAMDAVRAFSVGVTVQ